MNTSLSDVDWEKIIKDWKVNNAFINNSLVILNGVLNVYLFSGLSKFNNFPLTFILSLFKVITNFPYRL